MSSDKKPSKSTPNTFEAKAKRYLEYDEKPTKPTPEQEQYVEDLFGPIKAELKLLGLPNDDLWWVVEQAEAVGYCVDDLTFGQVFEIVTRNQREKLDGLLKDRLPDPDRKLQPGYTSASDKERDEWVYKQVKAGIKNQDILTELNKIAGKKKWNIFGTPEQIPRVVKRYVERTGATPLKPRKGGHPFK